MLTFHVLRLLGWFCCIGYVLYSQVRLVLLYWFCTVFSSKVGFVVLVLCYVGMYVGCEVVFVVLVLC